MKKETPEGNTGRTPMQNGFEQKVKAFIKENNLIRENDRILIGLSGGADSVCLVSVLWELCEDFSVSIGAFHVNHGIRGEEADRDALFSKQLCDRLGIPFYSVKEDVPERAKEWKMGLEEAGREVRYRAAERIAAENGYTKIALAHHQNDVAETFLFHLFRGSSVAGLASIPAKRGKLIRPLLCCDRDEIEVYMEEKGFLFCTDATNEETDYTRNKIRHRIVSYAKEEINAGAVRHMADTAEELSELEAYLEAETKKLCEQAEPIPGGVFLEAEWLASLHRVMQRRVVYRLIGTLAGSKKDLTKEHVEAVLGLLELQSGKRISLPYGLVAGRNFGQIYIKTGEEERDGFSFEGQEVCIPGEYFLETEGETLCFRTFPYKKNTEIPKNEYTKWFDYDKIRGTLWLRTYCEGDRMGMLQGSKTVKALWTEGRVPSEERRKRILLADEKQVLWIPGIRACDNYRVEETTKTVLEVQRNGGKKDGSER